MRWQELATGLFAQGHDVTAAGPLLSGTGRNLDRTFAVIGTTDHVEIGVDLALAMAREVLSVIRDHPARPILLLVDTKGQRLRRRDELLGINRYLAHLAQCLELARRRGHKVLGLVYDQAISGGFLAGGMMCDLCGALPQAEIRVMSLPAMARVTRLDEERLRALAAESPVFAPGVVNYVRMGAVDALWDGNLGAHLDAALAAAVPTDSRWRRGAERGGREMAAVIVERVAGE